MVVRLVEVLRTAGPQRVAASMDYGRGVIYWEKALEGVGEGGEIVVGKRIHVGPYLTLGEAN